ncbi:DNA-processing protein DprA [Haloferula sp. A504]|uniref:DNA-processing protein DprA n=1 Tax=Haloferula sp. A504 TaxID=3373601 RepID=UPI0031CAC7EC|nr:DNA-processing protein DprA [Verrucomicrobiaceae bacterium E54]
MLEHLVALNALPKIGPVRIRRLLDAFGSAEAILNAPKDRLTRVDGIGPETAEVLRSWESHTDPATELREVRERGLSLLTPDDEAFPPALREAYDAPVLLYVWGEVLPRDRHAIGVVGTRRATIYGKNSTKKLSFQLADAGHTILSGLARGIDTTAHEAALAARDGRTVAVIGSGLAKIFPAENLGLAEMIADGHGAVVSEFPLHTAPDKQTFPQRNRIVAAWSRALLVTESPAWSGSLITANLAAEYGRPVYAVPGPIDKPTSAGCHRLIRDGATLVTDAGDILDDLGGLGLERGLRSASSASDSVGPPDTPELPPEEQTVLDALGDNESGVDRLIDVTGLPAPTVTATLLKLEMKRLVQALPGFRYVRR